MSAPAIRSVAVVVPARDEQATIAACLLGVRAAVRALPASVTATVCVVLDRCQDETGSIARTLADAVLDCSGRTLGGVRDAGVRRSLTVPAEHCWVLNTDADSVVPPDWITTHLRLAQAGAHAVAGNVRSGVDVATMTRSISSGSSLAAASAACAARVPNVDVVSSGPAR